MKAFRAEEAMNELRDETVNYYTRHIPQEDVGRSRTVLENIIEQHGPVVSCYPHWHPLVASGELDRLSPAITPSNGRCGYQGLDHSRFLRNAFITCPYGGEERIFECVDELKPAPIATIKAERIDVPLYHPKAKPILVTCEWEQAMESDGSIPLSLAVPLLLEIEVPCWRTAEVAETWETMRRLILGQPCGARSSLFVNQETGQALKSLWNTLIYTGMFGPIKVG